MNVDLKQTFARIKPVCDIVMMCPNAESIAQFTTRVSELKREAIQELQQYLLFPFITHIKSTEIEKKYELQWRIIDAMKFVLDKVTVVSFEMCMKIETGLLSLIFDNSKPGMIADVPEELLLSVMKCLTTLMLRVDERVRKKLLRTQVPLVAQAVFVSVHIAKLQKLRPLRLAAIHCVTAHTVSHPKLTCEAGHIKDIPLEALVVDVLASILPGVLAALQDVATASDNPGHAVVVASISAIHRILCLTMHDKYLLKHPAPSAEDFARAVRDNKHKEVSNKENKPKEISKRSAEWYVMAGEKLTLISKCLAVLVTHDHVRVRRELAVYCARLLNECHQTMQPSVPTVLDILITLSKDEYAEVAEYSAAAVTAHLASTAGEAKHHAMDSLCHNFFSALTKLPRILNNVDNNRKLAALNLLHGYIEVMCDDARPQRLTTALASEHNLQTLVTALTAAAAGQSELALLRRRADRDAVPAAASGRAAAGGLRLWAAAARLGAAEGAALLLDRLPPTHPAAAALANAIASAPGAPPELARRIIDMYTEDSVWYLPLEVGGGDAPLTDADTLDASVYDPRAWTKDSVPGLFEGATETRTTGISYAAPRAARRDPSLCATLREAQHNMALACTLTEGIGLMAKRLGTDFQPYLLKTLCLVLERAGSPYEMLHLAGMKAIGDIAAACSHASVGELIRCNADYFTNQISVRLKKAWNVESALQILAVVMEHSDASILNCLYGIVEDVLLQSLDKYHERNLVAYLQVLLTFITCIRKWFPAKQPPAKQPLATQTDSDKEIDILKDLMAYVSTSDKVDKLMSNDNSEETGKTAEEMFREDQRKKEEDILDYDDRVTEETPPLPRHITATQIILKRCVNFLSSKKMDEAILALQILNHGLPILAEYENELLPLVHLTWAPLVATFSSAGAGVVRRAFDLLVTMASLAKDFIRHRTVTEVLPNIYACLHKSAHESFLKDQGSAYRLSAAFRLQLTALEALGTLLPDLGVDGDQLDEALAAVDAYLSNKQPKPLQELAVKFFKAMLIYDYGVTWHHLRRLASNERVLHPPEIRAIDLVPIVGTPYEPTDKAYEANVKMIFEGIDQQG